MWWVWFGLFAVVSAHPFGIPWGRRGLADYRLELVEYGGFPHERGSICLPSPFLGRMCLPSPVEFFLPAMARQRCLSIPIMRTYKVCPPLPRGENSNKSLKEIIKQDETEAETERLRDNANIEVNGGEVDSELFVKKGRSDGAEESKPPGENPHDGNKITRILEEMADSAENDSPERPPTDRNPDAEYVDIASNLV